VRSTGQAVETSRSICPGRSEFTYTEAAALSSDSVSRSCHVSGNNLVMIAGFVFVMAATLGEVHKRIQPHKRSQVHKRRLSNTHKSPGDLQSMERTAISPYTKYQPTISHCDIPPFPNRHLIKQLLRSLPLLSTQTQQASVENKDVTDIM